MGKQFLSHLDIRPSPTSEKLVFLFFFRLKFEALCVEQIIIENVVANLLKSARWLETRYGWEALRALANIAGDDYTKNNDERIDAFSKRK